MSGNAEAEAARSVAQQLDRRIDSCRHGGPPLSEVGTPWFQDCQRFGMWDPSPTDMLLNSWSGEDDEITEALVATINVITDRGQGFHLCLSKPGSRKYFAALAVDAWHEEEFLQVRKFLVKSIILYHLQHAGAKSTLQELRGGNIQGRQTLFQRVKGVLQCHEQGLKRILEFFTEGSCACIGLAQTLNDEKELLSNPNADPEAIEARRKQREDDRLPPVLKSSSKYWALKKKAAECLKKEKLDYARKLYLKAKSMLEEHKDLEAPMHEVDWLYKVGEEIGKLASNLSLVYLMSNEKEKALEYADEAVRSCPGWSKAYCRRASALKSLGRLEEGQVAIFNAIKKCEGEVALGIDAKEKLLKEFRTIQKGIEDELDNANQQQSYSKESPLYKPWSSKSGDDEAGTLTPMCADGIMDIIYGYLSPVCVAKLEHTCRQFAIHAERGRRIAIASKLLGGKDDQSVATVEDSFTKYVHSVDTSPTKALREFIAEIRDTIDDNTWKQYISSVNMDPLSLKTIVVTAFSNMSVTRSQTLFETLDLDFDSTRDFVIAKVLFQSDNKVCMSLKDTMISQMSSLDDEEGGFLKGFIKHSLDMEVMRLALSLVDVEDDDNFYSLNLKDSAFILLNNTLLSKGSRRRQKMRNTEDPLFGPSMEFHSLYTENVPDEWPGLIDDSHSWTDDSIETESIEQYWMHDSPETKMWRAAILKMLKWAHDVEKRGLIPEYLLVSRLLLGEMIDSQHSPISNFSFGPFLLMKAVEYGGAVSLSVRLRSNEDFAGFFRDFYDFLRLFSKGYPALAEYHDTVLAQHFSYMG